MSRKNNLTAWERWELASFEDDAPPRNHPLSARREEEPEPEVHIPTAEEIEQIHQQAYENGLEEGKAAGHKEGYEAGFEAGKTAGEKEGRQAGEEASQQLLAVAQKLDAALGELDAQVAEELTALALQVAQEVLRQTLSLNPATVVTVVRDALGHLPHQHANIYLHPTDAGLVREYAGDQLSHAGHRIHEDSRLQRGDVLIEAGGAQVDATLASRWRRVVATLGRDLPWDGSRPEPAPELASEPEPVSAEPPTGSLESE